MDNKTEYFTLKEDGVIGWIENMPPKPREQYPQLCTMAEITEYQQALQSAISNAIEVSNPEEVKVHIFRTNPGLQYILENTPYPLQCHVEKKYMKYKGSNNGNYMVGVKPFALVTFSEPSSGVEETQEITYEEYFKAIGANENNIYAQKVWQRLYHNGFMIVRNPTRKNK